MTSERDCIEALREAAAELGESPSLAQYQRLDICPSSATIKRVMGRWNAAKRAAGLETNPSTGSRTLPKPDDVKIPDAESWESLSADQRWHYRHRDANTERTRQRRSELRAWVYRVKRGRGCTQCDEGDPACLDFHHLDESEKEMQIGRMVTHGYRRERISEEIEKCVVLRANCHRKEHYEAPEPIAEAADCRDEEP